MSDRAPQYRNICYTINVDGEELMPLLDETHDTWQHVKYNVYQREIGEHEHFQGYMELTQSKTFEALHMMEGLERGHFEKRRGNAKQARHYCVKPEEGCECNICKEERAAPTYIEGPWEFGEISHQGQRADLIEIQRDLDRGVSLRQISKTNFPEFVRFGNAFKNYKRMNSVKRDFKSLVILICGNSGTGKSRFATQLGKYLGSFYKVPDKHTGFWCDDYDGEDVFFIDEMNGNKCTPEFFNGLIDRYEFVVPAHGSAGHQLIARYIIIASNYAPKFWWKKRNADQLHQTMRRIDWVMPFIAPNRPKVPEFVRVNGVSELLNNRFAL